MNDKPSDPEFRPDPPAGPGIPKGPDQAPASQPTEASEGPSVDDATIISARPPIHTQTADGQIAPRELGQTLVGRKLAHFDLLEFVGGGGMGAVFRASDTMLNRIVAVKVLSRDQGRDEETVKRFQNEAQSAARLDHDNIARVYFVGEDDGWYFIVFEYIEGNNLRDQIANRGPMSVEDALKITLQVAEALEHASHREVVHRDIKPSNVLLTRTGKAKLVDMGLARLQPMKAEENDLTASGVTLGTFDYISPEQARDPRMADVRSDIYSLGCTLFFMLTARPPFPDGTVLQKLLSHSGEAPPDPRLLRPDLPDELIPVISRMLSKQPADRYQKPSDLIGDLLALSERLGFQTTPHGDPIYIAPEPSRIGWVERHLPWIAPLLFLLTFVLFIDPIWLQGNTNGIQPSFTVPESARRPSLIETERQAIPSTPTANSGRAPDPTPTVNEEGKTEPDTNVNNMQLDGPLLMRRLDELLNRVGIAPDSPPTQEQSTNNQLDEQTIIVDPSIDDGRFIADSLVAKDLTTAVRLAMEDSSVENIELRHNERVELDAMKFNLENRILTISAANGYSPVLSFRTGFSVSDADTLDMLHVSDGELKLRGLHLELVVPNDTLEGEWALFALKNSPIMTVRYCTITVRNTYGGRFSNLDNVSVFRIIPDAIDDMLDPVTGAERLQAEIDLNHCVIRGETTVLRADQAAPLSFKWNNGLLSTTERLVNMGGAAEMPGRGEQIMIDLDHVTAVMDQGLGEFTSSVENPYLVDVSIYCKNSILLTQSWSPLISQSGPQRLSTMMAQIEYFGDRNFYEGLDVFWKLTPQDRTQTEAFNYEMWRGHWSENLPRFKRAKWQSPPDKNQPMHEHRVAEYALSTEANPAVGASQDGLDAGFQQGLLPRLPEPEQTTPRKTRPFYPF